ncbi:MAG TPA: carboxymuconolactone decarboxylase family protein [Chloroflexi bacterium]|nr:carboxymuconolactone decarboxylase family protein [Chloroflexota bacterium]
MINRNARFIWSEGLMTRENTTQSQAHPADRGKPAFPRRYYRGWKPFWRDLKYLFSRQEQIKEAMRSDLITPAFRERLMLAVTEVNRCRYCRTFHVGQAREAGITSEEIAIYLSGTIPEDIPEDQKLAVCFAQHWAESETLPDPEFQTRVIQAYGEKTFQAMSIVLRMIWMGNLMGNTADYLLFKITFGKLGV